MKPIGPDSQKTGDAAGSRLTVFAGIALSLFLLVYAVNARFNYSVKMSGDEYQYLKSARALLHGSFTIESPAFASIKGRFPDMDGRFSCFVINPAGKLVSYYSAGISLFFAFLLALFGNNVFWVTPVICDIGAMLCLFFFSYLYFKDKDEKYCGLLALLCVAVYGLVVDFHLGIRRDAIGGAMVMAISLLVFMAWRKRRWTLWQIAFALLTFLFTIKVSYALLYFPFCLLFFAAMKGHFRNTRFMLSQLLIAGAAATAVLTPFFIQNSVCTGHWFLPSQSAEASDFLLPSKTSGGLAWLLRNAWHMVRAQSHVYALKGTPLWTASGFAIVTAFGLWKERKAEIVRFWALPALVLFYGLYAATDRTANIYNLYLAPTCYLTVFLCVSGLFRAFAVFRRPGLPCAIALALTVVPFLALKTYRILPHHRHVTFQVPQARSLVADIATIVPPGGIVLCDKYLSTIIDYFSAIQSFPAADLKGGKSDEAAKITFLLKQNHEIYFCDYEGYDFSTYYKPYLAERFDIKLVKCGQALYNFSGPANSVSCNLYRVTIR